ncbi:MAG: PilZ domain-containing protein [Bryobacteraceae bacterium]
MGTGADDSRMNSGGTTDRRETNRFPVREEVRYRVLHAKGLLASGIGKTLDIGSGGILFTTEERLPMGRLVEVAVNWPVRLDGVCPLQFVAVGKVVRSEAAKAAVQIERYAFKTRGSNGAAAAAAG